MTKDELFGKLFRAEEQPEYVSYVHMIGVPRGVGIPTDTETMCSVDATGIGEWVVIDKNNLHYANDPWLDKYPGTYNRDEVTCPYCRTSWSFIEMQVEADCEA